MSPKGSSTCRENPLFESLAWRAVLQAETELESIAELQCNTGVAACRNIVPSGCLGQAWSQELDGGQRLLHDCGVLCATIERKLRSILVSLDANQEGMFTKSQSWLPTLVWSLYNCNGGTTICRSPQRFLPRGLLAGQASFTLPSLAATLWHQWRFFSVAFRHYSGWQSRRHRDVCIHGNSQKKVALAIRCRGCEIVLTCRLCQQFHLAIHSLVPEIEQLHCGVFAVTNATKPLAYLILECVKPQLTADSVEIWQERPQASYLALGVDF